MKFRKDFVTNSSSSSYICEITGEAEEVENGEFDDAGLCKCENDHVFYNHYKIKDVDYRLLKEKFIELAKNKVKEFERIIKSCDNEDRITRCKAIIYDIEEDIKAFNLAECNEDIEYITQNSDARSYYLECGAILKCQCPICSFKKISCQDRMEYIYKKLDQDKQSLDKEILDKFASYEDFENFIRGVNK